MKGLLVLLVTASLGASAAACGSANLGTGSSSSVSHTIASSTASKVSAPNSTQEDYLTADRDHDNDLEATIDDTNNDDSVDYGHAASAADKRAVTVMLKRYYAAATAENGAEACSMIVSSLAESVLEDYGPGSPGPSYLKVGTSCASVMTLLFRHFHSRLTVELPKLEVARVRLVGHKGLAVLSFDSMPEREIQVGRQGGIWKVDALIDHELP